VDVRVEDLLGFKAWIGRDANEVNAVFVLSIFERRQAVPRLRALRGPRIRG
jgi:hypothetical protein